MAALVEEGKEEDDETNQMLEKYNDIFQNFARNYKDTLKTMIVNTKNYALQ